MGRLGRVGRVGAVLVLLAAAVLAGAPSAVADGGPGLITRQGTKLLLDGRQYKFAGMNADDWFGCWDGEREATTDANLDRYFGELNPHSMTRIWAYPKSWDPGEMDRIVAAAHRHGQYLEVTLTDGNDDGNQCGGLPLDYADPGPMLAHVDRIVARYAKDNAVAIWEVCNECSLKPGESKQWYRAITDDIHARDPDGLVTIGGQTCYTTEIPLSDCVETNDLPNNDLISMHEYDWNDGGVSPWAQTTAQIAEKLDKPAFVGETGFTSDIPGSGDCGAQECNADRMVAEWKSYLAQPDFAGMMYWDFKWAHPATGIVNLDTPMWTAATRFRHQYQ